MHAAMQQDQGTMQAILGHTGSPALPNRAGGRSGPLMSLLRPRRLFIQGITAKGQLFRPSDWAERLAGAMSSFRPAGSAGGIADYIGYSPYCVPQVIDGVKCVIVSEALRDIEPMAWEFVMNFARDNELTVADANGETAEKPSTQCQQAPRTGACRREDV